MSVTYRKRGAVVRWENGVVVRVVESGEAAEEGVTFRCTPAEIGALPHVDSARAIDTARAIEMLAVDRVTVERLLVSEGRAEHELGETHWSESGERIHVALTRGPFRVLLDLGAFVLDDVSIAVEALARATRRERPQPPRLVLAPNVTAALLPLLVDSAPPNVELWQSDGGVDAYGEPIVEWRIVAGARPPNAYRPSYRVRPLRVPMNVVARCSVTEIESGRPRAVALLAPVTGLLLRVLVDDGAAVYPCSVRVTRIDAVSRATRWYPYGAGSFGAEMML